MLILPGIMALIIGIILFFTNSGDSWRDGMIKADIVFIVLGGVLLAAGIIFCSSQWCRNRPQKAQTYSDASPAIVSGGGDRTVQLVGVYRINHDDDSCRLPHPPAEEDGASVYTRETVT